MVANFFQRRADYQCVGMRCRPVVLKCISASLRIGGFVLLTTSMDAISS